MIHESSKVNQLMVFKELFVPTHYECLHPHIQLCPLLVLCASHSNKDLSDPVFETKLLLFLLSMFVKALNFTKKYRFAFI